MNPDIATGPQGRKGDRPPAPMRGTCCPDGQQNEAKQALYRARRILHGLTMECVNGTALTAGSGKGRSYHQLAHELISQQEHPAPAPDPFDIRISRSFSEPPEGRA